MASGQVSGLLNINKPKGITSHDVVARVRKISGLRKVGHTGTLDPMATGVLLVCVGQATRLIEYIMPGRKQYRATIRFGSSTDTLDADGEVTGHQDVSHLTATQLQQILPAFAGKIKQYPPIFSAIKKDGQPLYKRARAGETVEVPARFITIHKLSWVAWHKPDLTVDVVCSPGTYIRSLARDVGQAAGTGAHLAELVRTANGGWNVEQAVSLELLAQSAENWRQYLHPCDAAITHLPKVVLSKQDAQHINHGRRIQLAQSSIEFSASRNPSGDVIRAYLPTGQFLAILTLADAATNTWKPRKVF